MVTPCARPATVGHMASSIGSMAFYELLKKIVVRAGVFELCTGSVVRAHTCFTCPQLFTDWSDFVGLGWLLGGFVCVSLLFC